MCPPHSYSGADGDPLRDRYGQAVTAAGQPRDDVVGLCARDFETRGFAVVPGLIEEDQLERARAAADRTVAEPCGVACERPNNTLIPLRWNDELVNLATAAHPRIADAVGATDLRWISAYLSVKEAHSPPLWWHQDWWAWNHPTSFARTAPQIAVLCYLSDTTAQTGALRVLPGSHAASVPLHRVLPEAHSEQSSALDFDHPAMADQPGQITVAVRAGDAVVTDYRLLHGTHANHGDYRRDCVLLSFAPNWNDLPDDVRGHLIRHPALPRADELLRPGTMGQLLPAFDGVRGDLPVERNAPSDFAIASPRQRPA
jgi:hypothetical protein